MNATLARAKEVSWSRFVADELAFPIIVFINQPGNSVSRFSLYQRIHHDVGLVSRSFGVFDPHEKCETM